MAALAVGLTGVAVSAILWTFVSPNDALAYRGGFLLAALATTAVLFSVVSSQRSVLARCLSVAPLRYVGRISYGLYLWHFPLFIYLDHARTGLTGYPLFAVRALTTLMVATASFYLIERPIRQGSLLRGWRSWAITPGRGHHGGRPGGRDERSGAGEAAAPPPGGPRSRNGPPVKALIVGDSTAETLDIGLSENAGDYGIDSFNGGILGCGFTMEPRSRKRAWTLPWTPGAGGALPPNTQWPDLWKADIAKDHPNVVMILAGRWEVSNRTYDGRWTSIENPRYADYVQSELGMRCRWRAPGGRPSSS